MKYILFLPLLISSILCDAQIVTKELDTIYITDRRATYTYVITDTVRKKYVPPVVVAPTPSVGETRFNVTWDEPDALKARDGFGYWPNSLETFGTWKPTIIADPTNASNKVLQVGVNSSSKDGGRIRNELTFWNLADGLKQHATYSINVFIPKGFKTDKNINNIIQFHNAGKSGMIPNISFIINGNQLDLNTAWATSATATTWTDRHDLYDITSWYGRWVKIDMDINWLPNSSGYFKLYVDGKLFHNYSGPMGYAFDTMGSYLKIGIQFPFGSLPAGSTETSEYVLYDNIKIVKL